MTRKDYIQISSVFRAEMLESGQDIFARKALARVALTLCDTMKRDNPRFDKTRFLQACGFDYIPT